MGSCFGTIVMVNLEFNKRKTTCYGVLMPQEHYYLIFIIWIGMGIITSF